MTLYLRIAVGDTAFLIDTADIAEVDEKAVASTPGKSVDCRRLFASPATTPGSRIVIAAADEALALRVDQVIGLVELDDGDLRALPPCGRFGAAIDAIAVTAEDAGPPPLRLRPSLLPRHY